METKKCSCCQEVKNLEYFGIDRRSKDGHNSRCKPCANKIGRIYNKINAEKRSASRKKWAEANPDYKKKYYQENTEMIKAKVKKYRDDNIEEIRQRDKLRDSRDRDKRRVYMKNKYNNDPLHKIRVNCRSRINGYVDKGGAKSSDLIGCSYDELKAHLEKQFQPGMTWQNHTLEGWHIDHIIPLASAKTKEDLFKLFHHTNLQPLWGVDNMRKKDKIL